jgi:hypothetical protein
MIGPLFSADDQGAASVGAPRESNALMVVSFLFVGTLFLTFAAIIAVSFGIPRTVVALAFLPDLRASGGLPAIGVAGLLVGAVYGLGFTLYCLGLPILSAPCCWILDRVRGGTVVRLRADLIADLTELTRDAALELETGSMRLRDSGMLLYLYLRLQHPLLSNELKFLFNQAMFARSALMSLVAAFTFWLALEHSGRFLLGATVAYFFAVAIYCYTFLFWNRSLHIAYMVTRLART